MRIILFLLLLFGGMLASPGAGAQPQLQKAQALWSRRQADAAIALLQKDLTGKAQPADFYSTLGGWLYSRGRFAEAATVFEAGAIATRNGRQAFALPIARSHFRAGNYHEAIRRLSEYPPVTPEGRQILHAARWAVAQPAGNDTARSLGPRINTPYAESFPQHAADGQLLYYTRRVRGIDEELMRATPDSCGGWLTGRALPYPVNSPRQERGQSISADGHYIFFGREEVRSEDGWTGGGADLYMAYSLQPHDTLWSVPLPFGATINTPAYEGMPSLTADNKTLYFVSDRPGGFGGFDIWYSRFERGLWQMPVNAGAAVNTAGDEIAPFLCADGKTLFFASNGQAHNFGGYDLYRAALRDTNWSEVVNLGRPVNSPYDEISPTTGLQGDTLYFATDRSGPAGNTDIWQCALPKPLRPTAVVLVNGITVDSLSGERLSNVQVDLAEAVGGTAGGSFRTNRGDGSFSLFLQPDKAYTLTARQSGYKAHQIFLPAPTDSSAPLLRLALLPDGYVAPRHDSLLARLYFRKNEVTLRAELRTLLAGLSSNLAAAGAELLVWSFTDNSGTPLLNEEISALRARLVADALVEQGLPEGQLSLQGWGEAAPLATNDTEAGRDQNRRVEIILRK